MKTQVRVIQDSPSKEEITATERTENLFANQQIPDKFYDKI